MLNSVRKERRRSYPVCRPQTGDPTGGLAGSGAILRLAPPTGAPASRASLPCLFESFRRASLAQGNRIQHTGAWLTPNATLLTIKPVSLHNTQTFRKSKHNRNRHPLAWLGPAAAVRMGSHRSSEPWPPHAEPGGVRLPPTGMMQNLQTPIRFSMSCK